MTTADMLRAEGQVKTLTQQLTLRFDTLPDNARARLQAASADELTIWTDRVLTATSLDEIFN